MDHPNLFTLKFLRTFASMLISIIFLFAFVARTLSADPKFDACVPLNCGNGPNISYPFWIPDEQESYCGHPNFEITCEDKEPVLKISDDDYIIREIFYSNHSFLVTNAWALNSTCPTPQHNFTLDRTPFNYSSAHASLIFFYNCPSAPTEFKFYQVPCARNSSHYSFAAYVPEDALNMVNFSFNNCPSSVILPMEVDEGATYDSIVNMKYPNILKKGFVLEWTASNCSDCKESGGSCGFDNNQFLCFCQDRIQSKSCKDVSGDKTTLRRKIIIAASVGYSSLLTAASVGCGMIVIVLVCCTIWKSPSYNPVFIWKKRTMIAQNVESFLKKFGTLAPKRYSYSEIKKMTNSFKTKLGQGGFGSVFKGKLLDGRLVAVKVLSESKGDGEEFVNEVASISKTSHVNIVSLIGFCFDGFRRALVYEFMPNGSLEKFIYDDERKYKADLCLGWERIYQIATGIARGLEYLHRGCGTRILHFDIKPHNILLDQDFCPKISDFGLAKLCLEKDSVVSMAVARGTIGYIAPEVFSRLFGVVSHKSDVYSYGMMILEMVGGKINKGVVLDRTSETYFPHWIYKRLSVGENFGLHRVMTTEEEEVARKMILVGLWCIQADPSNRPSIRKVIEMLEGSLESLQLPPKPIISSPQRSACSSPTSIKCCSEMYLDSSFL